MSMTDRKNLSDESMVTLSPKSHWDKVVGGVKLPRIYKRDQSNILRFDKIFLRFLDSGAKTLFEVGCGSSAWLPYFKSYYGFSVSGLDYSEIGCEIARKNLEYFGRDVNDNVYCADVTQLTVDQFGIYDILFSYGLIEHFEMPQTVLSSIGKLVEENGQIVTIVPNLKGINGFLSRLFMPKIYAMHKVIDPQKLREFHEYSGFKTEYCENFGVFYPYVIPWENTERGFMNIPLLRRLFLKIVDSISKISLHLVDKFLPNKESSLFSPYVIYIGRR